MSRPAAGTQRLERWPLKTPIPTVTAAALIHDGFVFGVVDYGKVLCPRRAGEGAAALWAAGEGAGGMCSMPLLFNFIIFVFFQPFI